MEQPYPVGSDVHVLPSELAVPGVGSIPINSFVLHSEQPVLVDCGLGTEEGAFIEALRTVIDPGDLEWIWLTHDDGDHTGSLRTLMDLAPNARLATHGLGALRISSVWPLPPERVHALAPGDGLDVGDRTLRALRPPTYDNPMSTAAYDESSATLFAVDAFGAILPGPSKSVDDLSHDELVGGMLAWGTFDSPWAHLTDRARFNGVLESVRALGVDRLLPSHLPPTTGRVDELLAVVATLPDSEPFAAPDAAMFSQIVAGM